MLQKLNFYFFLHVLSPNVLAYMKSASLFEIMSRAFIFIFIFYISLFLCKLFHVFINIKEGQSLSYLFIYIQDRRGHFQALLVEV